MKQYQKQAGIAIRTKRSDEFCKILYQGVHIIRLVSTDHRGKTLENHALNKWNASRA